MCVNIYCGVAVRTVGFSPSIWQPYGANEDENINCFASSMPILRVNSYRYRGVTMAGCRKRVCVIIQILDCKNTRLWTREACDTQHQSFYVNVWVIHKDIPMIAFFVMDVTPSCIADWKSLEGMFALIKQRMNCKLSHHTNMWFVSVWTYTWSCI